MSHKKKSRFNKQKDKYFKLYKSYKKVYCQPLGGDVYFSDWGWQHISGELKHRTKVEAENRLRLIPLAKKLLESTTTIQRKRFQNHKDHYQFGAWMDGTRLVVVVVEYKKKFYFYSAYSE